jgi:hypothetical protein
MAKDYVLIQHPGERDTTDRPVTELDKQRWPQKWQQYINASEQVPDGTPIDILLPMHPEIASNMHSMGVHTIEQMANITADGLQRLGMGGVQLMNKAKDFLDKAERGVAYHRMESELAKRDNAIEVLANQNKMLKEQLDRLMAQITGGVPAPMIPTTPPATAFGMVPVPDVDYKHVNEARAEHHEATVRRRGRPPGTRNKPK